ncbi:hypothetical protein MRS44_012962 [Fusarium solani]|uniref:uncharacterized protein n=1 Tax=Fusarium solani TaxID=169388 RepID=UPI0032C44D05|nr:hypothetical protein MRS44_012962 [Fusarium solani]
MGIMALSPRDAIHADDLEHYDEFMGGLSHTQFLDMYLENHQVKIDVYEHPSNHLTRSVHFKPSPNADKYFHQEKEQANQVLGEPEHSGVEARDHCKRDDSAEPFVTVGVTEVARTVMPLGWVVSGRSGAVKGFLLLA